MHKPNKSMGGALLLAAIILPIPAFALQQSDYLPLTKTELGQPFVLKPLGELGPASVLKKVAIGPSAAEIRVGEETLIIEGRDTAGKGWSVKSGVKMPGLGGQMYVGDLDKNGFSDLVILAYTGGNGLAPGSHFISVMFDSSGRPTFFEADAYFEPGRNGFADLVDMDGDGKAELVHMTFDDGYWITDLYKARNARWGHVAGTFRGRRFPLYTRFTRRPNRKATTPMPGRHPFGPNLSNASPLLSGRLLSYKWQGGDDAETIGLIVKTETRKTITCSPDPWYSSFAIVVDNDKGREIVSLGAPAESIKSLLSEIIGKRYRIRLFGQRWANSCSPEILWASPSHGAQ